MQATEYYKAITNSDISRVDNVKRDAERAKRIMRSYARHQGSQASIATILADISANEPENVSDETIDSYLTALRKIFIIEDMPAWNPNLRSKTAVRTSDTRYYVDPSVGVAALGLGPNDLINDLNTFGLFLRQCAFEILGFMPMPWMALYIIIETRMVWNVMLWYICVMAHMVLLK